VSSDEIEEAIDRCAGVAHALQDRLADRSVLLDLLRRGRRRRRLGVGRRRQRDVRRFLVAVHDAAST
jgi:hypothetical protein